MNHSYSYSNLISIENLFQAWEEFRKGKKKKKDVMFFERNLEDNLFSLYLKLVSKTYRHGGYEDFYVTDPKRRHIHKAAVSDRIVHHLLYKYLYLLFDKTFIYDSYSCRLEKGTHKGVLRLERFLRKASNNYSKDSWALKLDIKKFFANVDHEILLNLLRRKTEEEDILGLLKEVIQSFCTEKGKGIPLGNLTSQVFANIYMNQLDQFIKHELKIKYYLRYADDFVIIGSERKELEDYIEPIAGFLKENLKLQLHPNKMIIRKLSWGIDFCGYIILPHYILPRTKTKRRIIKRILKEKVSNQSLQSYLGYLKHASSFKLRKELGNKIWAYGVGEGREEGFYHN